MIKHHSILFWLLFFLWRSQLPCKNCSFEGNLSLFSGCFKDFFPSFLIFGSFIMISPTVDFPLTSCSNSFLNLCLHIFCQIGRILGQYLFKNCFYLVIFPSSLSWALNNVCNAFLLDYLMSYIFHPCGLIFSQDIFV